MSDPLHVLIADDEELARERLMRLVSKIEGYHVCAMAENGGQAVELARAHHPDLVLLDIRMPDMDGIEAASIIKDMEPAPAIIFCTAYDEYALQAFRANAIGYLLKPVREAELSRTLKQACKLNQAHINALEAQLPAETEGETFVANTWKGQERIALRDILYFRADHKYVSVIHRNGETISNQTLKELEKSYEKQFIRAHRNTLVNRIHIKKLQRTAAGTHLIILSEGQSVEISRRHVSEVRAAFTEI